MNWIYLIPVVAAGWLILDGEWRVALAIVLVLGAALGVQWLADRMAGRRRKLQR